MYPAATALYLPRTCPWCAAAAPDPTREVCGNCAGPLPAPILAPQPAAPAQGWGQAGAQPFAMAQPSRGPGPMPPPPPRQLPKAYVNRVLYWHNIFFMLGFIFTVFFFWTIIFPAVGIPL